ncbi:MAG: tail fiber domain-containing protein, partial [Candidatus Pacebacteria bacterium]|nr:tail fiber domain-containing protein [Candidatus Paceibacterota bacterium]MCF7862547.1 tail fiber domain-containing protein [Candidatus Paceibacterota bacterium]
YGDALDKILNTPLHTFRYIKEVEGYGTDSPLAKTRLGYIADEVDPIFMVGNVIDQVSVNGILIASIKALNLKLNDINNLEKENSWRDALVAWLANATNKITRIFTGEICLTSPGEEPVCLNASELRTLKSNMNSSQTIIINNSGSSNTTENTNESTTENTDTSTDTETTTDTTSDTEETTSEEVNTDTSTEAEVTTDTTNNTEETTSENTSEQTESNTDTSSTPSSDNNTSGDTTTSSSSDTTPPENSN